MDALVFPGIQGHHFLGLQGTINFDVFALTSLTRTFAGQETQPRVSSVRFTQVRECSTSATCTLGHDRGRRYKPDRKRGARGIRGARRKNAGDFEVRPFPTRTMSFSAKVMIAYGESSTDQRPTGRLGCVTFAQSTLMPISLQMTIYSSTGHLRIC